MKAHAHATRVRDVTGNRKYMHGVREITALFIEIIFILV